MDTAYSEEPSRLKKLVLLHLLENLENLEKLLGFSLVQGFTLKTRRCTYEIKKIVEGRDEG